MIACNYEDGFTSSQYPTIREWIEAGHCLYVTGENYQNVCMNDVYRDKLNGLLSGVGSTMTFGSVMCGDGCNLANVGVLNPDVNMNQDLDFIMHALVTSVDPGSGTWIATTGYVSDDPCSETIFLAGEKIGDGYVVACGDWNVFHGSCSWTSFNCPYFRSLIANYNKIL